MNKIKLVNKIIDVDKSKIVYDKPLDDNWQDDWQVMAGEWRVENGCLVGVERGNKGGVLFFKQRFDGVNVMLTCKISTILPATRDVNGIFCAEWDDKTDYLGDYYVCGLKAGMTIRQASRVARSAWATSAVCRRPATSTRQVMKSNLLSAQSTVIVLCLLTANLLPNTLTVYLNSTRDTSAFRRIARC